MVDEMMPESGGGGDGKRRRAMPLPQTIRPDQTIRLDELRKMSSGQLPLEGTLLVIAGAHADVGTHLVIDDQVVIGRDGDGLQLRDGRISRRHAMVKAVDGGYVVEDLGSTNGTMLNGIRVAGPSVLRDGDKIYLGETVIKFSLVDETEARYLQKMERLAGTDELTGLLAKHRFDSLLAEAVRSALATGSPLAVLMMDMDGLKAINDRHGHQMGAHTISCVGRMLGDLLSGQGEGCRFGGDEFCACLPGHPLDRARLFAERFRSEVEQATFTLESVSVRASISIGIAGLPPKGVNSGEALLGRADQALYRAKEKGRNIVSD